MYVFNTIFISLCFYSSEWGHRGKFQIRSCVSVNQQWPHSETWAEWQPLQRRPTERTRGGGEGQEETWVGQRKRERQEQKQKRSTERPGWNVQVGTRRSSDLNLKRPSPRVTPSISHDVLYLIPLYTFMTGSHRIWMHSLDVASANQGRSPWTLLGGGSG